MPLIQEGVQKMTRQEMIDNILKKRGLEDETAIAFVEIAETWKSDKAVKTMYEIAIKDWREE